MAVGQFEVVSQAAPEQSQTLGKVAFFDSDGNPVEFGGGGESGPVAWADVTGKPATFPPTVGTTATTAKAGNYVPAWGEVTGKPAVIAAGVDAAAARSAIGAGTGNSSLAVATTAPAALAAAAAVGTGTTAARADHVHPFPTAANVGAPTVAQYTALEARVAALEAAGA